jgi:EF hand
MSKHQVLAAAILMGMICIATQMVQAKAVTAARQSVRAGGRIDVTGEVLRVDTQTRTITLRSGGSSISLDISNPVLQGYSSVAGIRRGDRVGAGYTADGIHIVKLSKVSEKGGPEKSTVEKAPAEKPGAPPTKKSKKTLPFARRTNANGKSFASVDNNKDGKISPIELSVVIPDLTIEQFRQYDKNHDGYLDKAEFEQIKLQ